ncbi:MAG: hypothetical protein AAF525_17455 [Pseudomonadota bacterium]
MIASIGSPAARWFACGLAFTLIYAGLQTARYLMTPAIGHDYAYFLPYLLSNHYWLLNNGWSIPWVTPAHCAGIPYFANPQSLFYSPVQMFMGLGLDPINALAVQHVLLMGIGFVGMWLLAGRVSRRPELQLLAAVLFVANGFIASRLAVGHVSFSVWLLVPLICVLITVRGSLIAGVSAGVLAGVLLSSFVHMGAVVLIVPCALAMLVVVLWLGRLSVINTLLAAVVALSLTAAKLTAMIAFMEQFPRDLYPLPGAESLSAGMLLLLQGLFWPPDASTMHVVNEIVKNRVFAFGADEFNYHIGMVPVLLMSVSAGWWWMKGLRKPDATPGASLRLRTGGIAAILTLTVVVNVYAPGWHDVLQVLPYFETVSSAFRWFIIWMLPIILATVWALGMLPVHFGRWLALGSLLFVVLLAEWHAPTPWQPYETETIVSGFRAAHAGEPVPTVRYLAESLVDGRRRYVTGAGDVLVEGGSQLVCNEPVFGYVLEHFRFDRVGQGPARAMTQFGVNFYRPECFLYPEENTCAAGTVFESSTDPHLRALLSYQAYPFEKPVAVVAAVLVSQVAIVAVLLLFLLVAGQWIWSRRTTDISRDVNQG